MISAVPVNLPMPNCQNIDKIDDSRKTKLYYPYFKNEVNNVKKPTTNNNIYNQCITDIGPLKCQHNINDFCRGVIGLKDPNYLVIQNDDNVKIIPIVSGIASDPMLQHIFMSNKASVHLNHNNVVTVSGISLPDKPIKLPSYQAPLNTIKKINDNWSFVATTDTFPDPQSPCPSPDHCDNSVSEVPWWIWLIIALLVVAVILAFTAGRKSGSKGGTSFATGGFYNHYT